MSGLTPPQPLPDFPDHPYIRCDDIIRPKPRRLVDMRRTALGGVDLQPQPQQHLQYLPPGASSAFPMMTKVVDNNSYSPNNNNNNYSAFTSQLPPILPVKPYNNSNVPHNMMMMKANMGQHEVNSSMIGKPLPPRPSSTSNYGVAKANHPQQRPQSTSQIQLQAQRQYIQQKSSFVGHSTKAQIPPGRSVPNLVHHQTTNLSSHNMYTPTPTPQGVPLVPFNQYHPQNKRPFLSPQPNEMVLNALRERILPPSAFLGGSSGNLLLQDEGEEEEEDANVPYYSELISPPLKNPPPPLGFMPVHQAPFVQVQQTPNHQVLLKPPRVRIEWKSVDNLQKHNGPRLMTTTTDIDISSSGSLMYPPPQASSTPLPKKVNVNVKVPEASPEYDRIKSPTTTEIAVQKDTLTTVAPGQGTDGSSDLDLEAPPSSKSWIHKGRIVTTPPSKMKSRRKNILHNLNSEEMRLLNTNNGSGTNNTGTGGSSSDGSSGHHSMSDSQTSGSPPAEYASITATTTTPGSLVSPPNANLGGYKSLLKSVPEDDTNNINPSSVLGALSDKTHSSSGLLQSPEKKLFETSSSGGKKASSSSSRSGKHKNLKEPILLENGASGLEDIKHAIEQLTLRSNNGSSNTTANNTSHHSSGGHHNSSYSTSTYSSMSGSECERHRRPHLMRYSSLDTVNTQVTTADEFVWVDSHSRLVELQHIPWSNHDILRVVEKSTKLKDNLERISMETVPRVSYLLQRALVRISRETQRLSRPYGFCSKHEVSSALRIVLSPGLADSSSKACLRAAAMFAVSTSDPLHRESKSGRGGLNLHAGRFHCWMIDVRLGAFVHEFAAIHLTAAMENLIEEILGQALTHITTNSSSSEAQKNPILTAALLEQAISNNGDLWGLLQPYAHLNAGRTASGALALPRRWPSVASVDSSGSSSTTLAGPSPSTSHHEDHASLSSGRNHKSLEQSLLTTCVGSVDELAEILSRVSHYHYKQLPLLTTNNGSKVQAPSWGPSAIHTLFYFMRCSQLENHKGSSSSEGGGGPEKGHHSSSSHNRVPPVQELVYERPFIVLPPLIEWVRVSGGHTDHRHGAVVDKDDVMQAARLLLPGIDCPPRLVGLESEFSWPKRALDEFEVNRRLKIDLAFKMLSSGRSDLTGQALQLMPPSKSNTFNELGLSPLILATIRGEEAMVKVLLDAGAEPDAETPPNSPNFPGASNELQHWTALTFAALLGAGTIGRILLEKGGNVEGGARLSEEKSTQTPLQVAAASGNLELVSLLLSHGANPFLSTLVRDSLCYTGSAQRGSFSALSAAASHGHRGVVHKLLAHPVNQPSAKEVLSLEDFLAEGAQPLGKSQGGQQLSPGDAPKALSKTQVKVLQEAMYQSAENGHLDITLDLRNLGVPWTLHCWINSLTTSYELRCDPVVEQLLHDFLSVLKNEDFSQLSFIEDCLPLLFTIFRNSKNEGTTLLLSDIFQTCYGREDAVKEIRDTSISNGTRIDPKYVNNPELSDVQFRVEGKVFYAHKIVLVTSSQRFKTMLKNAGDAVPPVLQINDIRYPIFQMVMEYLYNGNCDTIRGIGAEEVLELMAAANFFQLDGLLRFCESRCSQKISNESVVCMYIHAKAYNAVQLLEYCQGFLLQNMASLLTFDDSVRRLVWGKKLHNHDVLAGLLLTLQARLKSRPSSHASRKSK